MVGLMAGAGREQALSLLSAAKNHPDLAVKISSLKQAKEIFLSAEPSFVAQFVPYIAELQTSQELLVRKFVVELIEEFGLKVAEQSCLLLSILLVFLKDAAPNVVRQSIVCGTSLFCSALEEIALQFQQSGKVESWLEELWLWMVKFKDVVCCIALEPGSVGTKLLALKFIEILVLLFTPETNGSEAPSSFQIKEGKGKNFNVSWLAGGNPIVDPAMLTLEANKSLDLLLDQLQSSSALCGSVIIVLINCLAAIARRRAVHYNRILLALLSFNPNLETQKGGHAASIQYSLRTAFLGFLRCTHPAIIASRDRLLVALRAMSAGEVADQVIRQVDKMIKNSERALRDNLFVKGLFRRYGNFQVVEPAAAQFEDPPSIQIPMLGDFNRKRSMLQDNGGAMNTDMSAKRARHNPDSAPDDSVANGVSSKVQLLDSDLTPVEQMIAMIGALLAEGERGAESLEVLISKIHPDLLADIVIANMKHLPKSPPPLSSRLGHVPSTSQTYSTCNVPHVVPQSTTATISVRPMGSTLQVLPPLPSGTGASLLTSDVSPTLGFPIDSKRDPRRDPRRLDPRRIATPVGVQPTFTKAEDISDMQSSSDGSSSLSKLLTVPALPKDESSTEPIMYTIEMGLPEGSLSPSNISTTTKEIIEFPEESHEMELAMVVEAPSEITHSPVRVVDQELTALTLVETKTVEIVGSSCVQDSDLYSLAVSSTPTSEEIANDLSFLPLYVELTDEQQESLSKSAVARIIEAYRQNRTSGCSHARLLLLARLVAQVPLRAVKWPTNERYSIATCSSVLFNASLAVESETSDNIVGMLQKHIISSYQHQKGHELAMHVLYHLHAVMLSESEGHSTSPIATVYEKFLLTVALALRDSFPASDKSLSRLLGEAPLFPTSALKLLEDLCHSQAIVHSGRDLRNGDHVTQGLGAVWSLILGRPLDRHACLNIALKCSVHPQDDVRAKAIRLVANKLYLLSYVAEDIEKFATNMLLSVVDDQPVHDVELAPSGLNEHRTEANVGNQEPSVSGSQSSELGATESDSTKVVKQGNVPAPPLSMSQAQCCMSLFFALCTKKPSLLQLVFDIYGRAPPAVKQTARRLMPNLVKTIGSSYSELLHIIADPPVGSENLLMLMLKILTEAMAPSTDLIATVKQLYETKLKDAAVLIPVLSSLSKDEVLPIFPRLIDLPLDKFQTALARILQGSAHTGPALTPAEVLVAIHDIHPEKDGIALKKITDACSACFEQRTVFTQQVLAKSLSQLVEQTPLPLLFMRTVIQAIDAFPKLVDFVMGILSRLVSKQIWKMPKLWVGFLKCASQTRPHSFHVLLQLPPAQLESALHKHPNIRAPLADHANQPSIRSQLPRATLMVLGLVKELQSPVQSMVHASDAGSSVQSATLT